eukprot:6187862-Pleurochrysis_carterae.AAC.2
MLAIAAARRSLADNAEPKVGAQRPKGGAQQPKGGAQRPKGRAQRPKGRAQRPKGRAQRPKAVGFHLHTIELNNLNIIRMRFHLSKRTKDKKIVPARSVKRVCPDAWLRRASLRVAATGQRGHHRSSSCRSEQSC